MSLTRQKGKRVEREFAEKLRSIFPNVRRNAGTQSQSGGVDLEETPPFDFEVKGGKKYLSKMNRDMLDQVEGEGEEDHYKVVLVKPEREKAYAMIPFDDFLETLGMMKAEGIIK